MKFALWKLAAWMVAAGLAFGEENSPNTQKKAAFITVPPGVSVTVRINEALSLKKHDVGDRFTGVLESTLSANGLVAAEKQSKVTGRVVSRNRAMQGDELALELVSIDRPNGEKLNVVSDPLLRCNENSIASGAVRAGGLAALGAAIGVIAGGGRRADIGAAAGGAVGAAGATAPGKPVEIKAESVLVFRLREALRMERMEGKDAP
jgi:hypothetical protein